MKLYGKDWKRRELEARIGRIEQIGGLRKSQSTDGNEAGVEHIDVSTGNGLSYSILPSRGLDIGLTKYADIPISWLSPNGEVHPAFYDRRGSGWLRTAVGGLLMTCGLSQVGWPSESDPDDSGLHGQAHHTPAQHVCAEGHWEGDEYKMVVAGTIEETSIFGRNLCLHRQITSWMGKNEIQIKDVVENIGFEPAPHMLLYHFNLGFPLLDTNSRIEFPAARVTPREPELSLEGLENWQPPEAGFRERVYYHEDISTGDDGYTSVKVNNPNFPILEKPLSLKISWKTSTLPVMVQWKMHGQGTHVLGIEPANCHVEGQSVERERGTLVVLAPGQKLDYHLHLSIEI